MNIMRLTYIVLSILICGCTSRAILISEASANDELKSQKRLNQDFGAFKMGLVSYRITDTSSVDNYTAEFFVGAVKRESEYILVYNDTMALSYIRMPNTQELKELNVFYLNSGDLYNIDFGPSRNTIEKTNVLSNEFIDSTKMDYNSWRAKFARTEKSEDVLGYECVEYRIGDDMPEEYERVSQLIYKKSKTLIGLNGKMGVILEGYTFRQIGNVEGIEFVTGAVEILDYWNQKEMLEIDISKYKEDKRK